MPMKTQNKMAEIKFFDRFEKGSGYDVFDASGNEKIIDNMKKEIKAGEGSLIYDMGCGTGAFTYYIAKAYPRSKVIGLDISVGCITKTKNEKILKPYDIKAVFGITGLKKKPRIVFRKKFIYAESKKTPPLLYVYN